MVLQLSSLGHWGSRGIFEAAELAGLCDLLLDLNQRFWFCWTKGFHCFKKKKFENH